MTSALRFGRAMSQPIPDPTTGSGEIYLFPDAMGQNGQPFVFLVEDPPFKTRPRHHHHGDVLYVYVRGEHTIEGEATYRAGDLRWTKAGHVYGPETTGPDGGAWWVISYSDPIAVNAPTEAAAIAAEPPAPRSAPPGPDRGLPEHRRPYDWAAIDADVRGGGGAILKGLLSADEVQAFNAEVDGHLAAHPQAGAPASGSAIYDVFLGHRTVRLHGLVEKMPGLGALIGRDELIDWAERIIGGRAASVVLNAGELIQIGPGEPAQYPHRDTDSWPDLPIGETPVLVNAIVAFDPFTRENGATYIAPDSWRWDPHRQPMDGEFARAVMDRGDAVLFRGDLVHGGGENRSPAPRRAISISFSAGWLRTVENSFLNVSKATARSLPPRLQGLLGYAAHDALHQRGGLLGLYENGDPRQALASA